MRPTSEPTSTSRLKVGVRQAWASIQSRSTAENAIGKGQFAARASAFRQPPSTSPLTTGLLRRMVKHIHPA